MCKNIGIESEDGHLKHWCGWEHRGQEMGWREVETLPQMNNATPSGRHIFFYCIYIQETLHA